jgi:anaerobic ribonucleoside-triphosphate reductase activating protein
MMGSDVMTFAKINPCDIANGTGVRVSIFVSGCRRHCPGCHNQQAQDFNYGYYFDFHTIRRIIECLKPDHIDGLTILGGEPMEPENVRGVFVLMEAVRRHYGNTKTIWLYSGFTYDELAARFEEYTNKILLMTDVLVDGAYIESLHDITLRFRGSSNQRIIDVPASVASGDIVLWEG